MVEPHVVGPRVSRVVADLVERQTACRKRTSGSRVKIATFSIRLFISLSQHNSKLDSEAAPMFGSHVFSTIPRQLPERVVDVTECRGSGEGVNCRELRNVMHRANQLYLVSGEIQQRSRVHALWRSQGGSRVARPSPLAPSRRRSCSGEKIT